MMHMYTYLCRWVPKTCTSIIFALFARCEFKTIYGKQDSPKALSSDACIVTHKSKELPTHIAP